MSDILLDNNTIVVDDLNNAVLMYCETYDIDPKEITPLQWSGAMMYANKVLFADKSKLKLKPYDNNNLSNGGKSNNNSYDLDILYNIYIKYKELCVIYNMVVRLCDYMELVNISYTVIEKMQTETEPRCKGATITGNDFYKKIKKDSESSLVGRLLDKGTNPMKVLPILNNKHGWADKRTVVEHDMQRIAPKSRTDILAEFGQTAIESNEN